MSPSVFLSALLFLTPFHLGIFATMELGGFVPYALCMYLPLLPWGGSRPYSPSIDAAKTEPSV